MTRHLLLLALIICNIAHARTIEHALGTTVVPDHPLRVVVLTNEGTEALLSIGIHPIGAVKSWTGTPWYPHLEGQLDNVEVLGTESRVNIEKLAWLRPDLILANKQRHASIAPLLNAIAPTVYSESLRGNWKKNLLLYAKAVGREKAGQQALDLYQANVNNTRTALADRFGQSVSVIRFLPGHVRLYQLNSFSGVILSDLGFTRPDNQNVQRFALLNVGKEQVPEFDADNIIVLVYTTAANQSENRFKEWARSPLWKQLNAVKNNHVYMFSDDIWNSAGGILAANIAVNDIAKTLE